MFMNGHAAHADAAQIEVRSREIEWPDLTEKGGVKGRSQANIAAFLDRIGAVAGLQRTGLWHRPAPKWPRSALDR